MADDRNNCVNNYLHPPSPDEESQYKKKVSQQNKRKRKRKKKFVRKNAQFSHCKNKCKPFKFAHTMSTWAENFTVAATWQLKHQLAYWKARAKALEYENGVLHDIIKKKNYICPIAATNSQHETESECEDEEIHEGLHENGEDEEEDFEVSEEYIQFLKANAKYKEDARQERERLNAKASAEEEFIKRLEADPPESENTEEKLKELYGDRWQRIAALEMSFQSQFISECDKEKPMYWPNIPFNFNFG